MKNLILEIKEILTKYSNENQVKITEIDISPEVKIRNSELIYDYKVGIKLVK